MLGSLMSLMRTTLVPVLLGVSAAVFFAAGAVFFAAEVFDAAVFLVEGVLAAVFFAAGFLAAVFFVPAVFFAAVFLAGVFLAAGFLFALGSGMLISLVCSRLAWWNRRRSTKSRRNKLA